MDLYQLLLDELLADEKVSHVLALVALQLDHLPQLRVLHDGAVAAELLWFLFRLCAAEG